MLTEKSLISEEIVGFYKRLLGSCPPPSESSSGMGEFVSSSLDDELGAKLVADFSKDEIKDAMFSLHPNKAPGPDGFNAYFFQRTWHIVGDEVVLAIQEFFGNCKLLKESNATIIALIPKTPNATKLKDFRPISCCNTIYKCITKLLAGRLRMVLPSIINEAQAAFVQGRSIGDNILLAQELVKGYHTNTTTPRCAIKVDLMKAYDSVRWDFLWEALRLFGFPRKFIAWIHACVSTPRYSVSINGELNGYFLGEKGLRQGDPISPYLFVICMEVFSLILTKKTTDAPDFHYHWRCRNTKLTHLCFADDLMLFSKGDVGSVNVMKDALQCFARLSGLQPNPNKSEVFLAGMDDSTKAGILNTLGFQVGSLPVRYLGVPLISTKLRASDCRVLVDRIVQRVKSWTNQFLSFAGRLQLIQLVLFSIQAYWCSHFILPASVVKAIEGTLRAFLWKGTSLDKHGAKVAWEDVARPKEEGGLGIKRIKDWNTACMTRLIWKLCDPTSGSMWVSWVRVNLLNKDQFWVAKVPWSCSWTWRKVLKLRDKVRPHISMKIGNGMHTSLWFDSWMPRGQICSSSRDRVIYDSGLTGDAKVSSIIIENLWRWPLANSNELIDLKRETEMLPPPNVHCLDKLLWRNGRRDFSVRDAWEVLREGHATVPWFKVVWFKFYVPRHAFILWLAIQRKLATQDRLLSFGLISRMSCGFCHAPIEDHDHLFFRCSFTFRVWHSILATSDLQDSSRSWEGVLSWVSTTCKGKSLLSILGRLSLAATVYALWRERNRRKHEDSYLDEIGMIRLIQDMVRMRMMSSSGFPKNAGNIHLLHKWRLPISILNV